MKNLFQLLLLTCVTSTLFAADGSAHAAAVASTTGVILPTYDSELADLPAKLERSVSPDSRPYVGTIRRLELEAKHKHNIAAAEAVAAIYNTLPLATSASAGADIKILGTDLAKTVLIGKNIARTVTSFMRSPKTCLTPNARRSLLIYLAPKAPAASVAPPIRVFHHAPEPRSGLHNVGCMGTGGYA